MSTAVATADPATPTRGMTGPVIGGKSRESMGEHRGYEVVAQHNAGAVVNDDQKLPVAHDEAGACY